MSEKRKSSKDNQSVISCVSQEAISSPIVAKKSIESKLMRERRALNDHLLQVTPSKTRKCDAGSDGQEIILDDYALSEDVHMFKEAEKRLQNDINSGEKLEMPVRDSQICVVQIGDKLLKAWYPSPYADTLARLHKVFLCQFCLKCLPAPTLLRRHMAKCQWWNPPGNEIYRHGNISFWEVDGKYSKTYCQNLCLLAKLFLDHKTLYFDVEPFLFYVMTQNSSKSCQIVGYFSKEKESLMNCNLSCLLTLPCYQRKGYGRMLIDFSYLLSRIENRVGSPEHPLSDLGLLTYRTYWKTVIFDYLTKLNAAEYLSIKDLSAETGIHPNDIVSTLQYFRMIRYYKGKYIVLMKAVEEQKKSKRKSSMACEPNSLRINPRCLLWKAPNAHTSPLDSDAV